MAPRRPCPENEADSFWRPPRPSRAAGAKSRQLTAVHLDSDSEDSDLDLLEVSKPKKARAFKSETAYSEEDSDDDVVFVGSRSVSDISAMALTPDTTPERTPPQQQPSLAVKFIFRKNDGTIEQEKMSAKLFISLPVELHHKIIEFLPTTKDVVSYSKICCGINFKVNPSVWRCRFAATFDLPANMGVIQLADAYKDRCKVKAVLTSWDLGRFFLPRDEQRAHEREQRKIRETCLEMLKDLILESNAFKGLDDDGNEIIIGLNQEYIRAWLTDDGENGDHLDILDAVLGTHREDSTFWHPKRIVSASQDETLVLLIQLCLSAINIHPSFNSCSRNRRTGIPAFDTSQSLAYADHEKQPIFVGSWKMDINVKWLLSVVHFFKFHFKQPYGEGQLVEEISSLQKDQLPQPWLGKLVDDTRPVGSHWKGAFTFLDSQELLQFRTKGMDDDKPFPDNPDPLQDFSLFFDETKFSESAWPKKFETLIKSDPYIGKCEPFKGNRELRYIKRPKDDPKKYPLKSFFGTTRDERPSHFYGRMHALPPQQGIPGFQRISFIKFCMTDGDYDYDQVWEYEGCILPGGRIIVGRWRHLPGDGYYSEPIKQFTGPFIFWNVDHSAAEPPIEPKEALEFFKRLNDLGLAL